MLKLTTRRAVIEAAGQIDAELLDDVALHFRDGDLEHDLVAAAHGDAVDDLVPSPTRREAISKACCDSAGLAAVPESMTPSPTPSMWMSASGSVCLSAARTPLRSRVTAMSKPAICLPLASKKKMLVCPTVTPIM